MAQERPWGKGTPHQGRWVVTNDSDYAVGPVAGKTWYVEALRATYTASADVGSRVIQIQILNPAGNICAAYMRQTATASQVINIYAIPGGSGGDGAGYYSSIADGAAGTVTRFVNFTKVILEPLGSIRVVDLAAVAVGADDMVIAVDYVEHDA